MNVRDLSAGYYQVTSGTRWWTAMRTTSGWNIQNESGQRLRPEGTVGTRILAAIDRHKAGVK